MPLRTKTSFFSWSNCQVLIIVTLRHTTLGRTHLQDSSAQSGDLYLTPHISLKRHTSMSQAKFEPAITDSELP